MRSPKSGTIDWKNRSNDQNGLGHVESKNNETKYLDRQKPVPKNNEWKEIIRVD